METEKTPFTKQCVAVTQEFNQGHRRVVTTGPSISYQTNYNHPIQPQKNYHQAQAYNNFCVVQNQRFGNEEPIDLTIFNNRDVKERTNVPLDVSQAKKTTVDASTSPLEAPAASAASLNQPNDFFPKRRRKRRKFAYTPDGKLVLVPNEESLQSPASFSESKQLEILKAAKSLFSKRTRTLYHWMYPNAAKQQIKAAVTSSWESLGAQEKDFYISQVLGRFGFPQTSLMVNPQLDGIKELPLLTEVAETNKSKSRELQSAISSIMPENPMPAGGLTFEEFEEMNELTKKRRGRPPGSSNKKHKYDLGQDFKDDPELSQELEQFATMFNLSKI